jgi:hypothetical protein
VPASHLTQASSDVNAVLFEYVPVGHEVHTVNPVREEKVPAGQIAQDPWPVKADAEPFAQGKQAEIDEDPKNPLYVPIAHTVHVIVPVKGAKVPTGQDAHAADRVVAPNAMPYLPVSQRPEQTPAPTVSSNVPNGQSAHVR